MIRLAEEKDFRQLAEMRWQHKAEDDITYGETNIIGAGRNYNSCNVRRNFEESTQAKCR